MLRKNAPRGVSRLSLAARLRRDSGSTIVTVLIVMLVLTMGGLAISAIAMNTAVSVTDTRNRSAAQAEVDGAIATKSVELMTGRQACNASAQQKGELYNGPVATTPKVNWTLDCSVAGTVGTAVLQARANVGGEQALKRSVFTYEVEPPLPGYGDMNFYGNAVVVFTAEVHPGTAAHPITLVLPNAGFRCQGEVWGNVIAKGDIEINGAGCQVHGDLVSVDGVITGNQADARVFGNITTGGTGTNVVYGVVDGNVHTKGPISFSWSNRKVSGSVVAGGNVQVRATQIVGSLTIPASATATTTSGSYGSLVQPAAVPGPTLPKLPPWFEFQYKPSDWAGFDNVITLSASLPTTNPLSCGYYNSWPQKGWTDLNAITLNTVLDGRACPELSTNAGTSPAIKLPHNLLILAKKMDTTSSTWDAAPGMPQKPSVWFVTEDPNPADKAPTCVSPLGDLNLNHVGTTTALKAMAYTPCKIAVHGNSTFNGQVYGQYWSYGGGLNFVPDAITLPGMNTAGGSATPGEGTPKVGSFVLQTSQDMPVPVAEP